jgi:peptidoglycan/LPS O-acetylase OafA/YrhL
MPCRKAGHFFTDRHSFLRISEKNALIMIGSANGSGEVRNLTGIRAFAALWVVILHWRLLDPLKGVDWLHANPFISRGYLAVDLFFVLSGFIIPYVYHQKFQSNPTWATYKKYLLLRWARLYPNHFVIFLGYVALVTAAALAGKPMHSEDTFTIPQAIAHLLLLQDWQIVNGLSWNWPSWSISAEFFAYSLLFPFYAWLLRRQAPMWSMVILLIGLWLLAWGYGQYSGRGFTTYHSGLLRIAPEFLCGYLLYLFSQQRRFAKVGVNLLAGGSVLLLSAIALLPQPWEILALPALGGLILALYYGSPLLDRLFGNRIMVYLGHTSFALYMVHNLINIVFSQAAGAIGGMHPALFMLVLLIATQVTASLCFHLIEDPARDWMKRQMERPTTAKIFVAA